MLMASDDVSQDREGSLRMEEDWSKEVHDCCSQIWKELSLQKNIASEIKSNILRELDTIKEVVIRKQASDVKEAKKLVKTLVDLNRMSKDQLPTFSDATGHRKETFRDVLLRPQKIDRECKLVVKPRAQQAPEDTTEFIKDNVDPATLKICIHSITTKRNGLAIITMDSANSKEIVKNKLLQEGSAEYILENTNTGVARVIVARVNKEVPADTLTDKICNQNQWLAEGNDRLKLVKEFKSNYKDRDVVLEANPLSALKMIRKGYVGIGYDVCRVRPYVVLDHCFQCGQYGHHSLGRKCREGVKCVRCGRDDHNLWECKSSKEEIQCYICKQAGLTEWRHSAVSTTCPIKRKRLEELQGRAVERWMQSDENSSNNDL